MNREYFCQELKGKLLKINIKLDDYKLEMFYNYMNLIKIWNEKINLTAITEDEEVLQKHFVDSLTIARFIKENDKVIDVGTGAGFPGIPIKIYNENTKITLLDSLNKRLIFLDEVIKNLKLENISTIHARAEELAVNMEYRENFDVVTSRAVASLNTLLEYMLPFAKLNGYCICMKGSNIEDEIKSSKNALQILGGEIEKIDRMYLPDSEIERNILIVRKVRSTPCQYPRQAGKPNKNPL